MNINNQTPEFKTSSEAMRWLTSEGYTQDLNADTDCIRYDNKNKTLYPNQFEIDLIFRFEGMTDPGDESIVYAISSIDNSIKGILVNAYGAYSESLSEDMIAKLSSRK
jgi:hypothetical protein